MGDFTGFKFGGVSSSSLGIIRVSSGDRYEEQLHPEIKDITAEVPGLDGEYYFGSTYGTKTIDLEIAFDHITEEQFREIRRVFSSRKPQDLIFDERPYKKYLAKIDSPVELSYVCFDEPKRHIDNSGDAKGVRWVEESSEVPIIDEETELPTGETETVITRVRETIYPYVMDEGTERIYKGEGKITFVCRFPFAKSVFKVLPEGSEEWAISSGILSAEEYNGFDTFDNGVINVYNPGDVETGFQLQIIGGAPSSETSFTYKKDGENIDAVLIVNPITLKTGDDGVMIDTTNGLIVGMNGENKTTNIYNEFIESGYFFKIQPDISGDSVIEISDSELTIDIDYDYLYF